MRRLQVGACIVNQDKVILGIGYNGFPRGCPDAVLPWAKNSRSGDPLETKYPYVCHAEMNAILNKNAASVAGAVRAPETLLCFPKLCGDVLGHPSSVAVLTVCAVMRARRRFM